MNPTTRPYCMFFFVLIILLQISFITGCDNNNDAFTETHTDLTPEKIRGISLGEDTATITAIAADIYEEPDLRSKRLTQALFNQPAAVLGEKENWTKVRVVDGHTGWVMSNDYIKSISSLDYAKHDYKIIVISKTKDIFSHANNGVVISRAMMGTEFLSDQKVDNSYRITLPGNVYGWIEDSNTIRVPLNGVIPVTSAGDFVITAMKMKGVGYMIGGISALGIDSTGFIHVCAFINGRELPRDFQGQYETGDTVDIQNIRPGDLIFFSDKNDSDTFSSVGVYTGNGNFIHASSLKGYVTFDSLDDNYYSGRIAGIRRIFKS
jgi:gamma-D-glutamyl-L-lysine dipeptidyl-peptidase